MKICTKVLCLFLLVSYCFQANASQESDNEKGILKATLSYLIEADRLNDAQKSISKYLKKFPGEPEVLRLDGLLSYLKKDYSKSSIAFVKAASATEDDQKAINLYLLTQSHIKAKKYKNAEQDLNALTALPCANNYSAIAKKEFEISKTIPELNTSMLLAKEVVISTPDNATNIANEATTKPEEVNPFSLSLTAVVGSDSNPIFVPDSSDAKNSAQSTFYSVSADGTYKSKFFDGDMTNNLVLGYTNYQKVEAQGFNNLRLTLGTTWKPAQDFFAKNKLWFTNKIDRSYMTNKVFTYYYTGEVLSLSKEFEQIGEHKIIGTLIGGYRTYGNKDLTAVENDRTGSSFGIRGIHKTGRSNWAWLNSLTFVNQNTVGKKFNTRNLEFVTSYQKVIIYDIEALLCASYSITNYPNFTETRTDKTLGYGIDLSHDLPWSKGLLAKLSYSKNKNNSPVQESTYTQDVFSFWVVYDVL